MTNKVTTAWCVMRDGIIDPNCISDTESGAWKRTKSQWHIGKDKLQSGGAVAVKVEITIKGEG